MKIEIKKDQIQGEVKYPCLMTGKDESIVLFVKKKCGIVVLVGHDEDEYLKGEYRTDWIMEYFTLFKGTITLSND